MSALLAHVKAYRALAAAYDEQALLAPEGGWVRPTLRCHARAHREAANALEQLGVEECSGPAFEDRPEPPARKRPA